LTKDGLSILSARHDGRSLTIFLDVRADFVRQQVLRLLLVLPDYAPWWGRLR
jgi:hypothetical protein